MNSDLGYQTQQALKRAFDVTVAALFLMIFSPVILVIAVLVKLDSQGEIIYRQKRVGKDGREFFLYKFRSMVSGGDDGKYKQYLRELIESEKNSNGHAMPYRKMAEDPRITNTGRMLRKYYLDEIPQFINVLRGDMSVVGPRPHVQMEVDSYSTAQRRRLSVKPGLTGLWQVRGKADCTFSELIHMDLEYIDRWSFWVDIKTIIDTFMVMVRGGERYYAPSTQAQPVFLSGLIPQTGPETRAAYASSERILSSLPEMDARDGIDAIAGLSITEAGSASGAN
jgi:lipopolysaccharide/colanic/teichoic acid biosynthesis glycosyltransferase